jgi:hypothetical protein
MTTAESGEMAPPDDLGGCVYRLETDVVGVAEHEVRI